MLVWMTGELDYVDILYPKKEEIHLLKEKDADNESHYVGDSQITKDHMQFSGKSKQCTGCPRKNALLCSEAHNSGLEAQIGTRGSSEFVRFLAFI